MSPLLISLLDLLWPKPCLGCQYPFTDHYLCPKCFEKIELIGKIWQPSLSPLAVLGDTFLDGYEVVARLSPPLSHLIKALKYQSALDIAPLLGHWLWAWAKIPWPIDYICHVPLHPRRYSERGFNQAREIALTFSQLSSLSHLPVLTRQKFNKTNQAETTNQLQRQTQLHQIFSIHPSFQSSPALLNKSWLIIDDVLTTGNTLNECARPLKQFLKAKAVYGLTVAGH